MSKCDFSEVASAITLRHGCSPVNLLHIFRPPFLKNTSGWAGSDISYHRFFFSSTKSECQQKQPPGVFYNKRCS